MTRGNVLQTAAQVAASFGSRVAMLHPKWDLEACQELVGRHHAHVDGVC